jgi:hypothetical protein
MSLKLLTGISQLPKSFVIFVRPHASGSLRQIVDHRPVFVEIHIASSQLGIGSI